MKIKAVYELSMELTTEEFNQFYEQAYQEDYWGEEPEEYIDRIFCEEGLFIVYHNKQYKKKVKLIVDPEIMTKGNPANTDKLYRKLEKWTKEYFGYRYRWIDI